MITRETMFTDLLKAVPALQTLWDAFVHDHETEPETQSDGVPLYIFLGDLARWAGTQLKARNSSGLEALFEKVEGWHTQGDDYVQEAATIGFLEALQGVTTNRQQGELLNRWLGPESTLWWHRLNAFWEGDRTIWRE